MDGYSMNITRLSSIMSPDEQQRMIRHFAHQRGVAFVLEQVVPILESKLNKNPDDGDLQDVVLRLRGVENDVREKFL
jgi:hypothetical protein